MSRWMTNIAWSFVSHHKRVALAGGPGFHTQHQHWRNSTYTAPETKNGEDPVTSLKNGLAVSECKHRGRFCLYFLRNIHLRKNNNNNNQETGMNQSGVYHQICYRFSKPLSRRSQTKQMLETQLCVPERQKLCLCKVFLSINSEGRSPARLFS